MQTSTIVAVEWARVYDLRDDVTKVDAVQHATLHRPEYGLVAEPALLGTTEWWKAIEDGRVRSHMIEGVVSAVRWGSMGDWPLWRLRTEDGSESEWTREGDFTRYVEGLAARVTYAIVKFKPDAPTVRMGEPPEHNFVIKIELEASELRSDPHVQGPFGFEGRP